MKKLEESLEKIDLLNEERDKLKDKYEDSKVYIGQLKEKIESKPESTIRHNFPHSIGHNDFNKVLISYIS